MQGDGTAVAINRHHNQDPAVQYPSICYIDGDSRQSDSSAERVFRLPGLGPEAHIYNRVLDAIDIVKGQLAVCLHRKYEEADYVKSVLQEVLNTNRDQHLLYSQVGAKLGYISEDVVSSAFLTVWCHHYPQDMALISAPIASVISQAAHAS